MNTVINNFNEGENIFNIEVVVPESTSSMGFLASLNAPQITLNQSDVLHLVDKASFNLDYIIDGKDDWDRATDSLLHNADNTLFKSYWTKNLDFEDPVYIAHIYSNYESLNGSSCKIYISYTTNRVIWTDWHLFIGEYYYIKSLVYGLKIKIEMQEGWNGSTSTYPEVSSLVYRTVTPVKKYYISNTYVSNGMLFEYLLTVANDLPSSSIINWGICRGDSVDFNNFEIIKSNKRGCLSNRQYSLQYTDEIIKSSLRTEIVSGTSNTYQVFESNGSVSSWNNDDIVYLEIDGITVDPTRYAYSYDYILGRVILPSNITLDTTTTVTVTIVTPSKLITLDGEPAKTTDYMTYYASNGRWNKDSTVIVIKNGKVVRGGYDEFPDQGIISFHEELESDDLVSIFIEPNEKFRVGLEVISYDPNANFYIESLGLYFTEINNTSIISTYNNQPIPKLIDGTLKILSQNNSVYERLQVVYDYESTEGLVEKNSLIKWYRDRSGDIQEIISYRDRITQPFNDIWEQSEITSTKTLQPGDNVFVKVTPSDGIRYGIEYLSPTITINGGPTPIVWNLLINSASGYIKDNINYAVNGEIINVSYNFYTKSNNDNEFIVKWYKNDDYTTIYYEGKQIPENMTVKGDTLTYIVTPIDTFNNIVYTGLQIMSDSVQIV